MALFAPNNGMEPYYRILTNLSKVLSKDGIAFFETSALHHDEYLKFKSFSKIQLWIFKRLFEQMEIYDSNKKNIWGAEKWKNVIPLSLMEMKKGNISM